MKTMIQLFISLVVIAAVHLVSFEAHANQCSSLFRSDEKPGKISINAMAEPDLGSGIKADAEVVARVALELGLETIFCLRVSSTFWPRREATRLRIGMMVRDFLRAAQAFEVFLSS